MPARTPAAIRDRAVGALLGLAIGDALGGQLRFRRPDDYLALSDSQTGGVPKLEHGAWNHVTAAALALSDALAEDGDIDDRILKDRLIRELTNPYGHPVYGITAVARDSWQIRDIEAGKYYQNDHRLERALMERFTDMTERGCYSWKGCDLDAGKHMRAAARRWRGPGFIHASRNDPQAVAMAALHAWRRSRSGSSRIAGACAMSPRGRASPPTVPPRLPTPVSPMPRSCCRSQFAIKGDARPMPQAAMPSPAGLAPSSEPAPRRRGRLHKLI